MKKLFLVMPILLGFGCNELISMANHPFPLHRAAKIGDVAEIERLIQAGCDVNHTNQQNKTSLHVAVKYEKLEAARCLLEHGAQANIYSQGRHRCTPFHDAVEMGDINMIRLLLDHGADINSAKDCCNHETPLHMAVEMKNEKILRLLLDHNADDTKRDVCGYTALHTAAAIGWLAGIRLLADKNSNSVYFVNCGMGETPLHVAAREHRSLAVEEFLKRGVPVDLPSNRGETPLHLTMYCNPEEGCCCCGFCDGPLCPCFRSNPTQDFIETATVFIKNGAQCEARDNNGQAPLHKAAMNNNVTAIRFLNSKHIVLNVRDNNGCTPLYWATYYGHIKAMQELINCHADCNVPDNFGKAPIHVAVGNNNMAIKLQMDALKLFLASGADIDIQDSNGNSPLHNAVEVRNLEAVQLLVRHGARLDVRNMINQTPVDLSISLDLYNDQQQSQLTHYLQVVAPATRELISAVQQNNIERVHAALHAGAELLGQDRTTGDTPLHTALKLNNKFMVLLLLGHNPSEADLFIKNRNGFTVMDYLKGDPLWMEEFLKIAHSHS